MTTTTAHLPRNFSGASTMHTEIDPVPKPPAGPARDGIPASVSRYRSLRGKSVSAPKTRAFDVFADAHDENDGDAAASESPTRRRRSKSVTVGLRGRKTPGNPTAGLTPRPINLLPAPRSRAKENASSNSTSAAAAKAWAELEPPPSLPLGQARLQALNKRAAEQNRTDEEAAAAAPSPASSVPTTPTAQRRQRALDPDEAENWADEVARLDAETDRILAEQKKLDLARLQAVLKTPPPKPKRIILDKLTFFSRGSKKGQPGSQPGTPSTIASTIFSLDFSRASSVEASSPPDKMSFIEQGGRGIVPQIDAPTSAVNGGERRVTVRCLSSTINLPVTTDTSPVDIVFSSANLMSHHIDPETSIVVECFVVLGLERRLRRYERVRDVMNSWDRDQQNSLLILSYSDRQDDRNLDIASVPRTQEAPNGFTMQLYHSARPGKWVKRWVTMQENGQIFAGKKADSKPSDKDSTALCHLSDFDIYTPKTSEMQRHLKPPKKFCYAIKSQQKTIVFPNGENFVHFFCTDDNKQAQRFHDLVHGWRSWYLVNKQVDLQKKEKTAHAASRPGQSLSKQKSVVKSGGHRLKVSVDEKPYTIGQFQPLIDMDRFDKPIEEFGKDFEPSKAAPKSTREEKPKVLAKPRPQLRSPLPQTPVNGEREFSADGLLGDVYDKLKSNQAQPHVPKVPEGPFTSGPSLLNGDGASLKSPKSEKPASRPWIPSAAEHTARVRSETLASQRPATADATTRREKTSPLVNLSGNFPNPPPQRRREGHGHGVKPPAGSPLINFATGGAPPGTQRPSVPRSRSSKASLASKDAAPSVNRQRSRSTASQTGSRRLLAEGQPPMPPLPATPLLKPSGRREGMPPGEAGRGRDPKPREPLVNRAK